MIAVRRDELLRRVIEVLLNFKHQAVIKTQNKVSWWQRDCFVDNFRFSDHYETIVSPDISRIACCDR